MKIKNLSSGMCGKCRFSDFYLMHHGTEIWCRGTECTMPEKTKRTIKRANSTRKAFLGPKHGNFYAVDEKVLEFVLEKRKNGLPVTREAVQMKAKEIVHP
jgi:hypothetical protein